MRHASRKRTVGSLFVLALQYAHDLPHAREGAHAAPSSSRVCDGNHRCADRRSDTVSDHSDSLLDCDALEPPLTVSPDPLLIVVLGPTGSGKTSLSLVLAEKLEGEIVNCDSVAMYRDFEIGTAKPSAEERARVPHHCIDIVSPERDYSPGES